MTIKDTRYAIEHTLVEPFENFIRNGRRFAAFVQEIESSIQGTLPSPGTYDLSFPIDPTAAHRGEALAALREPIISWVRHAAEEMFHESPSREGPNRRPNGYNEIRSFEIEGLRLTLRRRLHWATSTKHDGLLLIARRTEGDLEASRLARIQRALDDKLPKLAACRAEGDASVLILEFSDIALTNHILIAQALEQAIAQGVVMPDHVFIAETTSDTLWHFFRPVIGGIFSIDMEYIEVLPPTNVGY